MMMDCMNQFINSIVAANNWYSLLGVIEVLNKRKSNINGNLRKNLGRVPNKYLLNQFRKVGY